MRTIATLALVMLVGGYGVARGQDQAEMKMQESTEMEEATKDFLGLKWGLGIGVMGGFGGGDAVEKASLVGTNKIVRTRDDAIRAMK